jgi:hypothetical protein
MVSEIKLTNYQPVAALNGQFLFCKNKGNVLMNMTGRLPEILASPKQICGG